MNLAQTVGRKQRWGRAPTTTLVLSPRPPQPAGGGLGGRNSALHRCRWGTRNNPRVEAEEEKSRGGPQAPIKMLKMKVDPEMYMKTKGRVTICPTQKTTFVHSCTPFYTKRAVFCSNRRPFCRYSRAGERIPRFKM